MQIQSSKRKDIFTNMSTPRTNHAYECNKSCIGADEGYLGMFDIAYNILYQHPLFSSLNYIESSIGIRTTFNR